MIPVPHHPFPAVTERERRLCANMPEGPSGEPPEPQGIEKKDGAQEARERQESPEQRVARMRQERIGKAQQTIDDLQARTAIDLRTDRGRQALLKALNDAGAKRGQNPDTTEAQQVQTGGYDLKDASTRQDLADALRVSGVQGQNGGDKTAERTDIDPETRKDIGALQLAGLDLTRNGAQMQDAINLSRAGRSRPANKPVVDAMRRAGFDIFAAPPAGEQNRQRVEAAIGTVNAPPPGNDATPVQRERPDTVGPPDPRRAEAAAVTGTDAAPAAPAAPAGNQSESVRAAAQRFDRVMNDPNARWTDKVKAGLAYLVASMGGKPDEAGRAAGGTAEKKPDADAAGGAADRNPDRNGEDALGRTLNVGGKEYRLTQGLGGGLVVTYGGKKFNVLMKADTGDRVPLQVRGLTGRAGGLDGVVRMPTGVDRVANIADQQIGKALDALGNGGASAGVETDFAISREAQRQLASPAPFTPEEERYLNYNDAGPDGKTEKPRNNWMIRRTISFQQVSP